MAAIEDLFRTRELDAALDDRTWNDLLLDQVFAHLDRTESSIGQQMLYDRLRSSSAPRSVDAFDALCARADENPARRERAQAVLARLGSPAGYFLHRLGRADAISRHRWHLLFPLWSSIVPLVLALGYFWPSLLPVAACGYMANLVIHVASRRRIDREIVGFRQVGPLLSAARELEAMATEETEAITGSIKPDLGALQRLGAIARWVSRDPSTTDQFTFAALEMLNVLFLMDASALYFASRELHSCSAPLLRMIEVVGEIDAAIAVASFRAGVDGWIRPRFVAPDAPAILTGLRHPLLDRAVPNSIALAPPHGVLVTGSNMSGKSTFLRTVGINIVLAQTTKTCLCSSYEAPVYQVRSCIGRSDDLVAGKSYYLVEVESVLALVRASDRRQPHLFIFDELFRGTNAIERIAAAVAVLSVLIGDGKRHAVIAATHDGEVGDLLCEQYVPYHLGDALGPGGLVFDYQLRPGPATSRNAIALLELKGAPNPVVRRALALASVLDRGQRAGASM